MDDGVALGVSAVQSPDGGPGVGREVVHHLGQVAGHDAVVGDGGDLKCRDGVVVLLEDRLLHIAVSMVDQALDHSVDLGEGLAWVCWVPLSAEYGQN